MVVGQTAAVLPTGLRPMLATAGPLPVGDAWSYEVKWDGVRALVAVEGGTVRATSRLGNDVTGGYPELLGLRVPDCVLDGELVVFVNGLPDFGALQNRMHVRSPAPALVKSAPVTFLPFDVLHLQDSSLLDRPYVERRTLLEALTVDVPPSFDGDGPTLLASTLEQGLEGLVAKRRDSPYLPGRRTADWIKVKHVRRQSAVVCGWEAGAGNREGRIGALVLGVFSDQGLVPVGKVGTGFTEATLRMFADVLAPLARPNSPFGAAASGPHWVEPVLVVDVEFTAWTRDGRLRHPSYKGIRSDLDAAGVVRE